MINVNVIPPTLPTEIFVNSTSQNDFEIYPNPNNGNFEVELKNGSNVNAKITIYNIVGKLIYENDVNDTTLIKSIKLNNVPNGIYFVKLKSNTVNFTKKIIVNK